MTFKDKKTKKKQDKKDTISMRKILEDVIEQNFKKMSDEDILKLLKNKYNGNLVSVSENKENIYLQMRENAFSILSEYCKKDTPEMILENKFERYAALDQYYFEQNEKEINQLKLGEDYFKDNLSYHIAIEGSRKMELEKFSEKISRMRPRYKRKSKEEVQKQTNDVDKIEERNNKYNTDISEIIP